MTISESSRREAGDSLIVINTHNKYVKGFTEINIDFNARSRLGPVEV